MGHQRELPGWVGKGETEFVLGLQESWKLSPPLTPLWHPHSKALPKKARALSLWQTPKLSIKKEMPIVQYIKEVPSFCVTKPTQTEGWDWLNASLPVLGAQGRPLEAVPCVWGHWDFLAVSGRCLLLVFST